MIVCKVWDAEYPWDVRVQKVCDALHLGNHEVHLAARNRDARPHRETMDGVTVHRLKPIAGVPKTFNAALMFPAFFNPRWIRHITRVAKEERADVILCRDLPLAPTSLWVSRRLGVPLVLDLAEDYPSMLAGLYNRRDFRIRNLIIRNPLLASLVERWVVRRADGLLLVTEEAVDRLTSLGVSRHRMALVSNTPTLSRISRMPHRQTVEKADSLRLVYLGLLESARGIAFLLRAVAAGAAERSITVDFFGADHGGGWKRLAKDLGITGLVTFHGYLPYDRALDRLHEFDVGVMPHHLSRHTQTTLPNKLFDYMAAGLPVLSSDAQPVRRLFQEEGCGLVFRDRDLADFLAQCRSLTDPAARQRMGHAGRHAAEQRYNWTADGQRLVSFLERIHSGEIPSVRSTTTAGT